MWKLVVLLVSILSEICFVDSYKVLYICPALGKSHSILCEAMVRHLVEAKHEVTYIITVPPEKPRPGMTIIDTSDVMKTIYKDDAPINIQAVLDNESDINIFSFMPKILNLSRLIVENRNVQKLIKDKNQKFDAVITEWMFIEIYAGFSGIFNCPLIWLSTVEPHWMILRLIDEIPNPAYMPDIMSVDVPPLSFMQRARELGLQIFGRLLRSLYIYNAESKLYEEIFVPHIRNRGHPVLTLNELIYNTSLVLSNSHVSMGIAARLPPNFISIGGYHIDPAVESLPKDLQGIMDSSKDGVIYFSMGSNLKSKHFPKKLREELLKVFGELKQTVLWKFEEDLPNQPSNVHILKWAPQHSILAHENCKLFITHGGLLSTTETIHFGVPVIGIPVFADQFINVARGVKKGYAIKVDLSYSLASDLQIAIQEILNNPRYNTTVKELSTIYHHRSVHPSKELVHWVEHVIMTGGARHLRSSAFLMPWYQKLYLDLLLVLVVVFIALKIVFCKILSSFRNRKPKSSKKKEN